MGWYEWSWAQPTRPMTHSHRAKYLHFATPFSLNRGVLRAKRGVLRAKRRARRRSEESPASLPSPLPHSVRPRGLEPPRELSPTRPSTLRVYQFRHRRVGRGSIAPEVLAAAVFGGSLSLSCQGDGASGPAGSASPLSPSVDPATVPNMCSTNRAPSPHEQGADEWT